MIVNKVTNTQFVDGSLYLTRNHVICVYLITVYCFVNLKEQNILRVIRKQVYTCFSGCLCRGYLCNHAAITYFQLKNLVPLCGWSETSGSVWFTSCPVLNISSSLILPRYLWRLLRLLAY